MKGAARGRVFGGNAGLWLFQKKFRSKDNVSNEKRQNSIAISAPVKDVNSNHLEFSSINEERNSIKCSPDSSTSEDMNDVLIDKKSGLFLTKFDVASINCIGKSNKRGVFGVRKRHFESTDCDSDTSVAMLSASSHGYNKRHRNLTMASSVQSSTASQFHLSSISSPNQSALSVAVESADTFLVEIIGNAARDNKIPNNVITDTTNLTQQSESTSVFDFDKDPVTQQLGSKTNLDAARQFFAQLDSDQTLLQIEDVSCGPEPLSTRKRSKVIRTTRGKLPSNVAKREYHIYCQACQSSKVKPFSMKSFLHQRSDYFRVGDVYDGMFDE